MKNFLILIIFPFLFSCIGPIKELETQIKDTYFDDNLDDIPSELPNDFKNKLIINDLWEKSFDKFPDNSNIIFLDDYIYLISENGNFYKISKESADIIYTKKLNVRVISGLFGISSNSLYFIDEDLYLTKINVLGDFIWRVKLKTTTKQRPIFHNNQIIIKYTNNTIDSIDSDNGVKLWSYLRQNPPLSINVQGQTILKDGILYSGFPGGKLIIIEADSGSFLKEFSLSRLKGVTDIERTNDVAGDLSIIDDFIFAASFNGEIGAFDRFSGSKIWSRKSSSYHGVLTDKVNLILTHQNDSIYNFDFKSGKTIWKNNNLSFRKISKPAIVDNYLLAVDYMNILHVLSLEDGELLAMYNFGNEFIGFSDSENVNETLNITNFFISDDHVYVTLDNKKLIKIEINE